MRARSSASTLGQAFEQGLVSKRYRALVRGWPAADAGSITHALAKDLELPSQGQVLLEARTDWTCLRRLEWPLQTDPRHTSSRFALLEASPHSGRRHQIRRHFKHIAHPIIGDATHGKGPLNRAVAAHLGLQRLWLHALTLELSHPLTGLPLRIEAPLGPEWTKLVDQPNCTA
jgi:tRNA pseudouridine65 synthase